MFSLARSRHQLSELRKRVRRFSTIFPCEALERRQLLTGYSFVQVADITFHPDPTKQGDFSLPVSALIDAGGNVVFEQGDGYFTDQPRADYQIYRGNGSTPELVYDHRNIPDASVSIPPVAVSDSGVIAYFGLSLITDEFGYAHPVYSLNTWENGKPTVLDPSLPPALAGQGLAAYGSDVPREVSINDSKMVMTIEYDGFGSDNLYLYTGTGTGAAHEQDLADHSLGDPGFASFNANGTIVFRARTYPLTKLSPGIFTDKAGSINPVISANDQYTDFYSQTAINNQGVVAFTANRADGSYVLLAGAPGHLAPVTDSSGPFPGIVVGGINTAGSIVFAASPNAGGNGIYTGSGSTMDKVIAKGDPLFGSTVTSVQLSSKAINDAGQIAFEAKLADGRSVVVRADPQVVMADIVATSPTWDTAQRGVAFGYTISGADLPRATTAALYWSADTTFDPSQDTLIAGSVTTTQTAVGTYGPIHVDASTLGTPPSGTRYLLAVVDPDNTVDESDETNNVQAIPLTDIAMLSASLTGPTLVSFHYATTGDPGPFTVGLYRSADGKTYDPAAPIATQTVTPSSTNPQTPGVFSLPAPLVTDPDEPYLLVVADPTDAQHPQGQIAESDETNNIQVIKLPDIKLDDVTTYNASATGDQPDYTMFKDFQVDYSIANAASPPFVLRAYLAPGPIFDLSQDMMLGQSGVSDPEMLKPNDDGSAKAYTTTFDLSQIANVSIYNYIIVVADPDSVIPEVSKTNNDLFAIPILDNNYAINRIGQEGLNTILSTRQVSALARS